MRADYVPLKAPASVEIEVGDGKRRRGSIWITAGKSLADLLNDPHAFIEFIPLGESHPNYLAKAQIVSAQLIDMPKFSPLHQRRKSEPSDDPYEILAVPQGAPWASVREAYLRLAKLYHPDRYSSVGLPEEVLDYLGAKARRINAAYSILESSLKQEANCSTH